MNYAWVGFTTKPLQPLVPLPLQMVALPLPLLGALNAPVIMRADKFEDDKNGRRDLASYRGATRVNVAAYESTHVLTYIFFIGTMHLSYHMVSTLFFASIHCFEKFHLRCMLLTSLSFLHLHTTLLHFFSVHNIIFRDFIYLTHLIERFYSLPGDLNTLK